MGSSWEVGSSSSRIFGRRQIQQLILTAGELAHVALEPVRDAEVAGHLRDPAADDALRQTQVLQPEGQLVPDLVGDDLLLGALHHVADLAGRYALRQLLLGDAVVIHAALHAADGCKLPLQQAHQRGFARAGGADQREKIAGLHAEADVVQHRLRLAGKCKAQIFNFKDFQRIRSSTSNSAGKRARIV